MKDSQDLQAHAVNSATHKRVRLVYFALMAAAVPSFSVYVLLWPASLSSLASEVLTVWDWLGFIVIYVYWMLLLGLEYWLLADCRQKKWQVAPRLIHRQCQKYPFIPAISLGLFTLLVSLGWLAVHAIGASKHFMPLPAGLIKLLVISAIFIPVATLLGVWASRRFSDRFLLNFHERQICYECSYDLRGNPLATCPECGFDNQSLYDEEPKANLEQTASDHAHKTQTP